MYYFLKYKFFHNLGLASNNCKIVLNFCVTLCPPHLHSISNCVLSKLTGVQNGWGCLLFYE